MTEVASRKPRTRRPVAEGETGGTKRRIIGSSSTRNANNKPAVRNGNRTQKSVFVVEDSGSDEDDIPVLETVNPNTRVQSMISVSSSDAESNDPEPTPQEKNWGAKSKKDPERNNEETSPTPPPVPSPVNKTRNIPKEKDTVPPPKIEITPIEEIIEPEPKPVTVFAPVQQIPVSLSSNNHEEPAEFAELDAYTVFRKKHVFGGDEFRLMKDDKTLFFTAKSKDGIGSMHLISKSHPVSIDSPGWVGFLRIHQSSKRFTLVSNAVLPNDDRDPEILGLMFVRSKVPDLNARQIKIVMTKNGQPFYPISKRLNLSRIAMEEANNPSFMTLISELPRKSESGKLQLSFSGAFVIPSVKNFVFRDPETHKVLIMVFKTSSETFRVKFRHPFTQLSAFGIAISIISGNG